jgi:hypothetical protein
MGENIMIREQAMPMWSNFRKKKRIFDVKKNKNLNVEKNIFSGENI